MSKRINIGVLGAGHLGKIHLRILQASNRFTLVGFYDQNPQLAEAVEKELGYKAFSDVDSLIDQVDVVDIVTPTLSHHAMATKALAKGKHIFIEKPITNTTEEAQELVQLAAEKQLQGMVGHVERFNPAFMAAQASITNPMFIETHRLAEFNPRGTDVSVVLDLMIHDIDVVLSVVQSPVKEVHASGVSVISQTPDIANARIVFENGCVANLTASRISMKNMRKSRFFQKDAYVSVDFLDKKVEVVQMKDAPENPGEFAMILQNAEGQKKEILFNNPRVDEGNAIQMELEHFADAIEQQFTPNISLQNGAEALRVAHAILNCF